MRAWLLIGIFFLAPGGLEARDRTVRPKSVVRTVRLKYANPHEMVKALRQKPGETRGGGLLPEGIESITADARRKNLRVKGLPEAIEEIQKLIRLLDVPPITLQIKGELLEIEWQEDQITRFRVLPLPEITALNDRAVSGYLRSQISNTTYYYSLTAKANADHTVNVAARLRVQSSDAPPREFITNRRVPAGTPVVVGRSGLGVPPLDSMEGVGKDVYLQMTVFPEKRPGQTEKKQM